nr:GerMN domain-containing protein [Cellulomonas septica]
MVRDDRLEAVRRPSTSATLEDAVEALSAGPSRDETRAGLRSAVAVDSVRSAETDDEVVVVDVSHDFVETSGSDQLLAVAQLVWTVTEASGRPEVRLTSGGDPVEVPTDRGLSSGDVARDDYASVAPTADP